MRILLCGVLVALPAPLWAEAKDAVVRIPSHGGSGTVIATGQGWSLILSAGHCFAGASRGKAIALDVPVPAQAVAAKVGVRILGVDEKADVALLYLNYGPLPYVAPVAPAGFRPGPCLSVGYDEMTLPGQVRPATIVSSDSGWTYTRERPWHGRSGGGLIDQGTGFLVGVVSGYTGKPNHRELDGSNRGVYAGHAAILGFLARTRAVRIDEAPYDPRTAPYVPQGWAQPTPWTPWPAERSDPFDPINRAPPRIFEKRDQRDCPT